MEMMDRDFDKLIDGYERKIDKLQDRVTALEEAIRKHRDAKGHNRCWENDNELYYILPETPPDAPVLPPTKEAMLEQCKVYIDGQFAGLKPPFQLHKNETGQPCSGPMFQDHCALCGWHPEAGVHLERVD